MSATANPGDHTPALHDLATVLGSDDTWAVVGLVAVRGDVVQIQNTRTQAVFGVSQNERGEFRTRSTGQRVWFAPADAGAGNTGARPQDGPELHLGSEHQGLSGVWVACSCGLSTKRQTARYAEAAWTEYRAHALDALRSAVQTAWDTRQAA